MQLIRLLPLILLFSCAFAAIRPQSYIDAITAATSLRFNGDQNVLGFLYTNSTTDPSITMGGNRDIGAQNIQNPAAGADQSTTTMSCRNTRCEGAVPANYQTTFYYQLDGADTGIGSNPVPANNPSLGAGTAAFDFSSGGESGLFVNVTRDHTITITFSIYSGANPSNANRYSYALIIPQDANVGTIRTTYFIPYNTWTLTGSASFRAATAFTYVVEGDIALDWILHTFTPYATTISGRVFIDCSRNCVIDTAEQSSLFTSSLTVTATDVNDNNQQFSFVIPANVNPTYTIGVFIPIINLPSPPSRVYRVCSSAPQGYITTDVRGCSVPASNINAAGNGAPNCLDVTVNFLSDITGVNFGVYRLPLITAPQGSTFECTSSNPSTITLTGTPTTNVPTICQQTVTPSDSTSRSCGANSGSVSVTRTWTVIDEANASATSQQVVSVSDRTPPTITPAANTGINCSSRTGTATVAPTSGTAVASDVCSLDVTVAQTDSAGSNTVCYPSIIRTWTATDPCNNIATSTQYITFFDNQPPSYAVVPSDRPNLECDRSNPGLTSTSSNGGNPSGASDNCDLSPTPAGPFESGPVGTVCTVGLTYTRRWTLTDDCGNQATATQTLTVRDTLAPTFVTPDATTFDCNVGTLPLPIVSDQCDPNPEITAGFLSPSGGSCSNTRTRRITATDVCGNTRTADQTVTVQDNTPPGPSSSNVSAVNMFCTSTSTTDPSYPIPRATDNCNLNPSVSLSTAAIVTSPNRGPDCASYTFIRTWIFDDGCLTSTYQQTVSVTDPFIPTITAPAQSFFDCTLIGSTQLDQVSVSGTAQAFDQCSQITSIQAGSWQTLPPSGACFNNIQRTWTASDGCGNTVTATQLGSFTDTAAPVITNSAALVASFTAECGVTSTASPVAPNFVDSCNRLTNNGSQDDFVGIQNCGQTITRTWSATDCSGRTTFFTQTITVSDNLPPSITAPADTQAQCGPNGGLVLGNAQVSDVCGLGANVAFTSPGGSTTNNCNTEQTFIWTIFDACGRSATDTQVVTIIDNQAPTVFPPIGGGPVPCTDPLNTFLAGFPTATDNCGTVQVPTSIKGGDNPSARCTSNYTYVRTWTFTDGCNPTTYLQTVTVQDTIPPNLQVFDAPDISCVSGVSGPNFNTATIAPEYSTAIASDPSCSGTVTLTPTDAFTQVGVCQAFIERTWLATDGCGNTSEQTVSFNIVDNQPPSITFVPAPTTLTCAPAPGATAPGAATVGTALAADTCDPNPSVFLAFPDTVDMSDRCSYVVTRSWVAQDFCGQRSNPSTQIFTLVDRDAPIITIPQTTQYPCTNTADLPILTDPCGAVRGYSPVLTGTAVSTAPCAGSGQDIITRTWTASDNCGNSSTATQIFTAVDNEGPSFNAPPTYQTTDCLNPTALNPSTSPSPLGAGSPSNYFDICHPTTPVYFFEDSASAGNVCRRTVVRSWTAADGCGNVGTATQLIVAVDNLSPVFSSFPPSGTVPCDSTVSTAPSNNPPLPVFGIPVSTDNCQVVVPTSNDSIIEGCPRILRRTWTVQDACNPPTTQTQIITFIDQNRPSFSYFPPDAIIPCDVNADTSTLPSIVPGGTAGVPTAVDACDPAPSLSWQDAVQNTACPTKSIARTWIARDNCANIFTRTQVLTLQLVDPPTLFVPPDADLNCLESTLPSNPRVGTATASQQCNVPIASVTYFDVTNSNECDLTITRTWVALDQCGLRSTEIQSIIRGDISSPEWTIFPADVIITCDEDTSPINTGIAIASDDCTFPVCDVTWDDYVEDIYDQYNTLGTCPLNKRITRTWTARDNCGNELVNTQEITVLINTPSGPCAKQPCEVEKCTPCECNYRTCDCCTGPKSCTAVACKERVACTAVPCNTVNCIPCAPLTDIYPLPFCDDSVPCIPVIIPVFVDDDGVFQSGDTGEPLESEYWLLRADYWKDLAIQRGIDNAKGVSSNLAPMIAFVVLLISLPFTFYAFLFN